MAEAIFAKYSKSGGGMNGVPPELVITNSTKSALGLTNSATLDDCLRTVALSDPGYSTVQVTLKDVDGAVLPYHSIRMQDPTGFNMVYTTDSAGQCIFKTQNGQMTFSDWSNNQYFDVAPANTTAVDCPVGMVRSVSMQRYRSKSNGASINITSSQDINFSKYADTVDAEVVGADGRGGGPGFITHLTTFYSYNLNYNDGPNFIITENNTISPRISVTTNRYIGWINNIKIRFLDLKANYRWYNSGGRAGKGSISKKYNINIQNKNVKTVIGFIHNSPNINVFSGSMHNTVQQNDTSMMRLIDSGSHRRFTNRGATGGSSSFLDIVGNGGAGGNNAYIMNYGSWEAMLQGNNGGDGLGELGYGAPNSIDAIVNIKTSSSNINNLYATVSVNFSTISYSSSAVTAKNGYVKLTNFRYK